MRAVGGNDILPEITHWHVPDDVHFHCDKNKDKNLQVATQDLCLARQFSVANLRWTGSKLHRHRTLVLLHGFVIRANYLTHV